MTSAPLGATGRRKVRVQVLVSIREGGTRTAGAAREDTAGAVSPMLMVKEAMVSRFQLRPCDARLRRIGATLGSDRRKVFFRLRLRLSSRRSVKRFGGVEPRFDWSYFRVGLVLGLQTLDFA